MDLGELKPHPFVAFLFLEWVVDPGYADMAFEVTLLILLVVVDSTSEDPEYDPDGVLLQFPSSFVLCDDKEDHKSSQSYQNKAMYGALGDPSDIKGTVVEYVQSLLV